MTPTRRAAAAAAVALALLAACTDGDDAGPAPTTEPTTPTTVVDRSGIALAGVAGQTTTTIREVGEARLTGTVQGPGGLIPGATVTVERLVAGRVVRTDVVTGPDGRFLLENVPGGRYRVRAFLPPTLAQLEPEIRFLRDGEEHSFELEVVDQGGIVVRADVAPEPPIVDQPVNLVVLVVTRTVGTDGIVRSIPVTGVTVELGGLGAWVLRDDGSTTTTTTTTTTFETSTTLGTTTTTSRPTATPTAPTDAGGRVRFELRCEQAGPSGLHLRVPVRAPAPPAGGPASSPPTTAPTVTMQAFDLDLPPCEDAATTTTATTAAPPTSAG